ncbi:MAG: hypothetical protein AAGL90_12590 [Pseudomonadota bacterium]
MEEKRKDLRAEKQRKLLEQLVDELSRADPNFYYQSTSDIAYLLKDHVTTARGLTVEDRELLAPMSARDIQMLLSIR